VFAAAGSMIQEELRFDLGGEVVDLDADVGAQQLESGDACQRDERCGDGVFGKFKTGFVIQKSLNHVVAPFVCD
jgi:hypothetical protein